ncbi:uncharacterized protein [Notothenia coriiceps]|uniref:MABP domain-containing protein n=1 Tax=Notothenia coriiceps TaxID=8208 RepID=A0A6I9P413_9TELE|nr:PREDICTED: uncharacterized protein LOC104956446 [Notothenia coriiceps]
MAKHITKAYITDLQVSLNPAEEQFYQSESFNKINVDLNKGPRGNAIYLWYKHGSEPITKVQVSFNENMAKGLIEAGYTQIYKDLNAGAGGNNLYLWYSKGTGEFDTPIVEITVTADPHNEAPKFGVGYERVSCDLNRVAGGNWIHLWLKREKQTYICDITATDSYGLDTDYFRDGYIRMDEDTNRGADGAYVFIWYRRTTDPEKALKDLQVSINDSQHQSYQQQQYHPVSVNLNEGTGGKPVYMWYKKEGSNQPIKSIALLLNTDLVKDYEKHGVTVIERNLNECNNGCTEYLCFYQ